MNILKFVGMYSEKATGFLIVSLLLILPLPAVAVLGDTAASVLNDQARMKGTLRSVDNRTYVMHEITTPSGTVVREFASPQGAVFGVAWEGQFKPDLQQLLGPYYPAGTAGGCVVAASAPKARSGCDRDPGFGGVRNRTRAKFPRTGLHSEISAAGRPGQRNPLRGIPCANLRCSLWRQLYCGWRPAGPVMAAADLRRSPR